MCVSWGAGARLRREGGDVCPKDMPCEGALNLSGGFWWWTSAYIYSCFVDNALVCYNRHRSERQHTQFLLPNTSEVVILFSRLPGKIRETAIEMHEPNSTCFPCSTVIWTYKPTGKVAGGNRTQSESFFLEDDEYDYFPDSRRNHFTYSPERSNMSK